VGSLGRGEWPDHLAPRPAGAVGPDSRPAAGGDAWHASRSLRQHREVAHNPGWLQAADGSVGLH